MTFPEEKKICQNCDNLRIDNFCLVKMKYILSKNINKQRECSKFVLKLSESKGQNFDKKEREEIVSRILQHDIEY